MIPRPFLKWAGGKAQLAVELTRRLPEQFAGYHEPFLGGGALFFALYRAQRIERATLSDLNGELVDAYIAIRDCASQVVDLLATFPHNSEFYYRLRAQDPRALSLPARAARMIYLNKTGYNGLYRVNKQGQFNVPFGRHRSPRYCERDNLHAVSQALQTVTLACAPFEQVLDRAQAGDLVYFDPPYAPLSTTSGFTAYHSGGFSAQDQEALCGVCLELTRRNVFVVVSNSDTEFIRRLYSAQPFRADAVLANRAINCRSAGRGKLTELVITNYPA